MKKINLGHKLSLFSEHWSPKIIAELNGQHVKVAKLNGEFVWHAHAQEEELFLVLEGELEMHFRDRIVQLQRGELIVVPRGTEHKPVARGEVHVLLFEPAGTRNTGAVTDRAPWRRRSWSESEHEDRPDSELRRAQPAGDGSARRRTGQAPGSPVRRGDGPRSRRRTFRPASLARNTACS